MSLMKIRYEGKGDIAYQTLSSSGFDVYVQEETLAPSNTTVKLSTGVYIAEALEDLEFGDGRFKVRPEIQVRPRSSAFVHDWLLPLGTVDLDYRGQIMIVVRNVSSKDRILQEGERLAQLVGALTFKVDGVEVRSVKRGDGGFGSTGGTK